MLTILLLAAAFHSPAAVHVPQSPDQELVEQTQLATVVSDCRAQADAESGKYLQDTSGFMKTDFHTLPAEEKRKVILQIQNEGLTVLMVMQQCLFKNWDDSAHSIHPIAVMDIVGRIYTITSNN